MLIRIIKKYLSTYISITFVKKYIYEQNKLFYVLKKKRHENFNYYDFI